jgi:hypothetical protein
MSSVKNDSVKNSLGEMRFGETYVNPKNAFGEKSVR